MYILSGGKSVPIKAERMRPYKPRKIETQNENHTQAPSKKNRPQERNAGVPVQGDVTRMLTKFWYHIPFVCREG